MAKKILILSASTGAGHVRAGEALRLHIEKRGDSLIARHLDIADVLSSPMRKAFIESYNHFAARLPSFWKILYRATNTDHSVEITSSIQRILNIFNKNELSRAISEFNPDQIISTHFLPPLLSEMQSSIVITDYDIHALWIVPKTRHFFVATEEMKNAIGERGIPRQNITVSGIPIHPAFYVKKSTDELKERYKIQDDKKIILLLSGGYGLMRADKVIENILKTKTPLTVIAIAGKNKKLLSSLKNIKTPPHINLITVGWTDSIDEYMRMADVIIGKPGGLTTTESVSLGKPFIAIDPIPGHEDANVRYLQKNSLGVLAENTNDLLEFITKNPNKWAGGTAASRASADIILDTIQNLI